MAIKAVLATKKLGEHLRRDAQHMRVTGARLLGAGPTSQRADGPSRSTVAPQSSMRCWRGGSSTWSFVSRHQDTSTVPHQGFILEPARAFTRERQKLGAGGVAALVERTLEGGDWCLEDLSFYSFCSDPPFWAAANPSFGSHGWEEGKARRQLVEKKGFRKGKKF